MKFFEKNMKYFVIFAVVVAAYYVYKEMKARKEAKEMEEALKQDVSQNGLVLVDDLEPVNIA